MRIIIAGSRDFNDYKLLRRKTLDIVKRLKSLGYDTSREKVEIISGTARGADKLGEAFAKEFNLKCVQMSANWDELGRKAGYIRNKQMSEYAKSDEDIGVLIAFWNGSKGTKHMIDIATKDNLLVEVINF